MSTTGTATTARPRPPAAPFPAIVAILGPASRVVQATCLAIELELQGRMTVMSHVRPPLDIEDADDIERWNTHYQPRLAETALRRIEMADEVYVVGTPTEIGETIRAQIDHARSLHKPVRHWTPGGRRS
jgi:hypothetical protein